MWMALCKRFHVFSWHFRYCSPHMLIFRWWDAVRWSGWRRLVFSCLCPQPYMRPFLSTPPTTSKKMKLSDWWSLDTSSPSVCCEFLSKIRLSYSSYKIRVHLNSYVQKYEIKLLTTIKFIYKPTHNNLNKLKLAFN